ncbi:MAG TPA: Hsp70 family protein, partial [Candidatus Limnocylindria bacterium]|nr:Hsp70 family protein [Candidatus Limnocylindria bacterium]
RIIERNSTIPTKKSQVFSTAEDNQTAVDIRVVQGEREFARDNKELGLFRLDGIALARRGQPQIEVTFDIDANGMVHVSAKDKGTGKEQKITITSNSGLSKEEIERMVQEAKAHEHEDRQKKETIEKRNKLDGMIIEVEKSLKEHKEKLSADDVQSVEKAVEKAKTDLKEHAENAEQLQKSTEELMNASYKIAEVIYKNSQAAQGEAAHDADSSPDAHAGQNNKQDTFDAEINS